jgi:putative flippase GtrA
MGAPQAQDLWNTQDCQSRAEEGTTIRTKLWPVKARSLAQHSLSRFLLVGVGSYVFDLGILAALHSGLGVRLAPATTIAFVATLGFNFGLNKIFAFRSGGLVGPAFVKYVLLVVVNYITTIVIVTGLVRLGQSYVWAKTAAVALNAVLNYLAYRFWVFRSSRVAAGGR